MLLAILYLMDKEYSNQKPSLKIPPQDLESEKSTLGSLMMDKDAIIKVADFLHAEDFYKNHHQLIYQVVEALFNKGEPIDLISVSSKLKENNQLDAIGGVAYLTELINIVPTASHIVSYAKMVQKKRILRDLITAGQDIAMLGYEEAEEADQLLDSAEKRIFGITQKSLTQSFLPIKPYLAEAYERMEKLSQQKGVLRGVSTGFYGLDSMLSGLQNSDLIILAARPSMGKSSLAMDIAKNVAVKEKKPVGIFSLEMSKDQLIDRMISSESNIDSWKIRQGHLSSDGADSDFACIQHALGTLSEAPIYIDDAATCSVLQMRAMARRLQSSRGLGLIVIDYLQLIDPNSKITNSVQQITEISRALKGLARELNVPVLALSQLSRAVEQRTPKIPRLSDLRESGCLTGDTLIVLADTGERKTIKELAERKEQIPLNIFSLHDDYKVRPSKMTKVFYSGKKKVFELQTQSGRKIKASANHPFFKLEGWKRLDELKQNDFIALYFLAQSQEEEKLLQLADSGIYWDKILSVTELGVEDVYDATVENTHNFVANDIIVHNSLEQDADVVLLIYREDAYREDSPRQGVADIIIAKHRNGPVGRIELAFDKQRASFRNLETSRSFEGDIDF